MSGAVPPDRRPLLDAEGAAEEGIPDEILAPPAVVVVMVTRDPGPAFEAALASVAGQDYPGLSLLVVDAGSGRDPADRVMQVVPDAFVRRVGPEGGFAAAANVALSAVEGAAFLCFCHDDVVLDPGVVRLLVEEAYRSNAGICGPKLVDFDHPELLLEVGRAIDRFGGAHTGIEPGELDQEQHDAVRDVFYVSSATMLVRADLFAAIGGFDPEAFPGSEDLDLCWRARLAGARVMVVPDARVRHRQAGGERAAADPATRREIARRRLRTLFVCSSIPTLLWVVPIGLTASLVEAAAFCFTRRRAEAFAEVRAWWCCVLHPGSIRRARRRAQAHRTIHDAELHELQLGWRARVRSFLTHHHADERMESMGDRLRRTVDALADTARHPGTLAFGLFVLVLLLGSREILTDGVPAVGSLVRWTGARELLEAWGSAWRFTGLGAPRPASAALAGMAGLTTALAGHPDLAQTLLTVGLLVLGPVGVARLVRGLGASRGPALTAAILYGVNPVARNALANGRLGPLVLFGLAPFIMWCFVRAAGFGGLSHAGRRWPALLGAGVLMAVATASFPPAAGFVVLVAVACLAGSICTGRDVVASLRGLGVAAGGILIAGALLAPWSITVRELPEDRGAFGLAFWFPDVSLADVLRFHTGPSGAGIASWGIYAAAGFALVVAVGPRLSWVARAWFLAAGGFAAVFVPSQVWPREAVPPPEGALVASALGLAVAAGLGIGAFGDELRRARFGWRQLTAVLAAAGIALLGIGFAADAVGGRWHSAAAGWDAALSFTEDLGYQGEFRILWIGDPAVLPTDPFAVRPGVAYALTRNGPGRATELWRAPGQDADAVARAAVALTLDGRTNRLGRLVAPMGVRYIAAPVRNGPGGPERRGVPGLSARLADQLDLAQLHVAPGIVLYENTAWFPAQGVAAEGADVPRGRVAPIPAALTADLAGQVVPLRAAPVGPGRVLYAQAFDEGWEATAAGRSLRHGTAFGWSNSFALPDQAPVELRYGDQRPTTLMVAGQALAWLLVAVVLVRSWSRGCRRIRGTAGLVTGEPPRDARVDEPALAPAARRARRGARRGRVDDLDEDFWGTP